MANDPIMKCIVIRRCNLCGEYLEIEHRDYLRAMKIDHIPMEHECEIEWDNNPLGKAIGIATFAGYVVDYPTVHA